jgi:uncharacterized repeat protein (TIGR03803 family)
MRRSGAAELSLLVGLAVLGFAGAGHAAAVEGIFPFVDTGSSTPSNYAKGSTPRSELLQASDGNFYGTTEYGGSGPCPTFPAGGYTGCGTVFEINAKTGAETVIFNFPFDTATNSAPDGAYPTAGLIQGKDGSLYGVATGGGLANNGYGCNGAFGCGTLFRISPTGAFTLLHQFCGDASCDPLTEGGQPLNHLVQTADGTLYGVTAEGGQFGDGTLFSATTSGVVTTLHDFVYGAGDGDDPIGALLVGHDGNTLYGTTAFGGAFNGGLVFSYGPAGYTIIHSFDNVMSAQPFGALIYGADGLLYGTTASGESGSTLFSLNTAGGDYTVDALLSGAETETGLLLGSDGMMYGTLLSSDSVSQDGGLFTYNSTTKVMQTLVAFSTDTGAAPQGVPIEGKDRYVYGTNSQYGGSNSRGVDAGTLYRIGPPLKQ